MRARVRAQLRGLCKGDPEPALEELVSAFGYRLSLECVVVAAGVV